MKLFKKYSSNKNLTLKKKKLKFNELKYKIQINKK